MTVFAHNGVEHAGEVESAAHSLTGILIVSIAAITLMALAGWLLSRSTAEKEKEDEVEE